MNSHALAKKLLELADRPVVIIMPAGGPYTVDFNIEGGPWFGPFTNDIRIQVSHWDDARTYSPAEAKDE